MWSLCPWRLRTWDKEMVECDDFVGEGFRGRGTQGSLHQARTRGWRGHLTRQRQGQPQREK